MHKPFTKHPYIHIYLYAIITLPSRRSQKLHTNCWLRMTLSRFSTSCTVLLNLVTSISGLPYDVNAGQKTLSLGQRWHWLRSTLVLLKCQVAKWLKHLTVDPKSQVQIPPAASLGKSFSLPSSPWETSLGLKGLIGGENKRPLPFFFFFPGWCGDVVLCWAVGRFLCVGRRVHRPGKECNPWGSCSGC